MKVGKFVLGPVATNCYIGINEETKEAAAEGMSGHCFLNHEGRPLLLKKVCPELDRILKDLSENPPSAES